MARLQYDLFSWWPVGHPDAPTGIVGMTVSEEAHRPQMLRSGFGALGGGMAPGGILRRAVP